MTIKWERKNTEEDKENVITEKESLGNEKKWKGWGEKETTQAEKEVPTLNQALIQAKPSYPIPMLNASEGAPPIQVGLLTSLYDGSLGGHQGWGVASTLVFQMGPHAQIPHPPLSQN